MKRNIFVSSLLAGVLCAQSGFAALSGSVGIDGNGITVSGTADKAGEYVTAVVREKDSGKLMRAAQNKTDADKNWVITFDMPETFGGADTDGEYEITVHLNKSEKSEDMLKLSYSFVRESVRARLLSEFQTKSADEIVTFVASDALNVKALEAEGINGTGFAGLGAEVQKKVLAAALDGKNMQAADYSDFADDVNYYVAFYELNGGKSIKENLKVLNPTFDGKKFTELSDTEQEYIAEGMKKKVPLADYSAFGGVYADLAVLLKLNYARYSDIDGLLDNYKDNIGITGNSCYLIYGNLADTDARKQVIQENIVLALSTMKVYDFASFITVLETQVNAAVTAQGGSYGGGGGGGGASSPSKNTHNTVTVPFASTVQAENEDVFVDLESAEWAKKAVLALAEKGIVSGKGNKEFAPDDYVKREEFVKMIVCAAGIFDESAVTDLADVKKGSWYEPYVASAVNGGLVFGQGDNLFGVGQNITRQDACVIAGKLLDGTYDGELNFEDNDEIADYAKESVRNLCAAGVVSGTDGGRFAPRAVCTRAQAAKIIYEILERR